MEMERAKAIVRNVKTPSGQISYAEAGSGPVALFVHGALLNKHLWRHQLAGLSDIRRCIAVDLLAHGETEIEPNQNVSSAANANMLNEMLDALQIERIDLIGNHSGGGVVQIQTKTSRSTYGRWCAPSNVRATCSASWRLSITTMRWPSRPG